MELSLKFNNSAETDKHNFLFESLIVTNIVKATIMRFGQDILEKEGVVEEYDNNGFGLNLTFDSEADLQEFVYPILNVLLTSDDFKTAAKKIGQTKYQSISNETAGNRRTISFDWK